MSFFNLITKSSKLNFILIFALSSVSHIALFFNWYTSRNLLSLYLMISGIILSVLSIIPMVKEYFAKVRVIHDLDLLEVQMSTSNEIVDDLRDSKQKLQLKLSEQIEENGILNERLDQLQDELSNTGIEMENIQGQLIELLDQEKELDRLSEVIIELRRKALEFVKDNDAFETSEEIETPKIFGDFLAEFSDMKDLIFQLKTLSFRVDVQASLLDDSEISASSKELESVSRNLAKFFNQTVTLLAKLEETYSSTIGEYSKEAIEGRAQINELLDKKQDFSMELSDSIREIKLIRENMNQKVYELTTVIDRRLSCDDMTQEELDLDETHVISATNNEALPESLLQ